MTPIDTDHHFTLSMPGTEESVRETLGLVRARMQALGLSDDICGNVEIALGEALNNIVEHAYADISGSIDILGEIKGENLLIEFRDQGHPMPDLSLPKGALPDREVALEDLPEGGFGWYLIHSLTKRLLYSRTEGGNCLSMVFSLQESPNQDLVDAGGI